MVKSVGLIGNNIESKTDIIGTLIPGVKLTHNRTDTPFSLPSLIHTASVSGRFSCTEIKRSDECLWLT